MISFPPKTVFDVILIPIWPIILVYTLYFFIMMRLALVFTPIMILFMPLIFLSLIFFPIVLINAPIIIPILIVYLLIIDANKDDYIIKEDLIV